MSFVISIVRRTTITRTHLLRSSDFCLLPSPLVLSTYLDSDCSWFCVNDLVAFVGIRVMEPVAAPHHPMFELHKLLPPSQEWRQHGDGSDWRSWERLLSSIVIDDA